MSAIGTKRRADRAGVCPLSGGRADVMCSFWVFPLMTVSRPWPYRRTA